jgi:hypothetical protein
MGAGRVFTPPYFLWNFSTDLFSSRLFFIFNNEKYVSLGNEQIDDSLRCMLLDCVTIPPIKEVCRETHRVLRQLFLDPLVEMERVAVTTDIHCAFAFDAGRCPVQAFQLFTSFCQGEQVFWVLRSTLHEPGHNLLFVARRT